MEYKTRDGEPTTLYKLVHQEPDWAVNRIANANKEIESLRNSLQVAEILLDTHKKTEAMWYLKYQILRGNLTDEKYGELCELWPELSPE